MAILNYTTTISTEKTTAEIQKKLAKAKAQAVLTEYDEDSIVCAISFRIMTNHGIISFRLPANVQGVFKAIKSDNDIPKRLKTKEQAARVAWRIIKDWIEAQLAIVNAEIADITEVFLPYAQGHDGKTVYESIEGSNFKQLTKGN